MGRPRRRRRVPAARRPRPRCRLRHRRADPRGGATGRRRSPRRRRRSGARHARGRGASAAGDPLVPRRRRQPAVRRRPALGVLPFPTRAWELAVGALLALGAGVLGAVPRGFAAPAAWAGVGAILVATFVFDVQRRFPGWAAVLPVIGAAAIIALERARAAPAVSLRSGCCDGSGRISYSLYLWQWPLLLLPTAAAGSVLLGPCARRADRALRRRRGPEPPFRRGAAPPGVAAPGAAGADAWPRRRGNPRVARCRDEHRARSAGGRRSPRQGPGAAGEASTGPDGQVGQRLLVRRRTPRACTGTGVIFLTSRRGTRRASTGVPARR